MSLSPFHPPIVCSPTVTILALLSVLCMLCMLCMLYGSLPTILLLFARAAPSPHVTSPSRLRPAHALLPVTPPCGYTSHVPCSCPPHGSASHALHHGPGSPSAAHVTAHTTPHTVTITLDTDAVTSPPRPGPHTPPRRSHSPCCPLTKAHGSPLATPPAHSLTLKPSRFTHDQPGPARTGHTTKGPPSPLYLARVRSLLAIPRFL
jgi:hypothetical protein